MNTTANQFQNSIYRTLEYALWIGFEFSYFSEKIFSESNSHISVCFCTLIRYFRGGFVDKHQKYRWEKTYLPSCCASNDYRLLEIFHETFKRVRLYLNVPPLKLKHWPNCERLILIWNLITLHQSWSYWTILWLIDIVQNFSIFCPSLFIY